MAARHAGHTYDGVAWVAIVRKQDNGGGGEGTNRNVGARGQSS